MVEALVNFFRNIIPGELTVFILSMMPIIELRGGLVAAKMLGVDLLPAMLICFIGTILPTPFILLFINKILLGIYSYLFAVSIIAENVITEKAICTVCLNDLFVILYLFKTKYRFRVYDQRFEHFMQNSYYNYRKKAPYRLNETAEACCGDRLYKNHWYDKYNTCDYQK